MKLLRILLCLTVVLASSATALFAQSGTTGALTGVVTQGGSPLPGATVTVASPSMQGMRTAVTNDAGGYNFGALPPGEYTVRFELAGLQTVVRNARVGVAQTARLDAELRVAAVAEAITVTASAPAVAETNEVQTNFTSDVIEDLPVGRTVIAITNLSPGVSPGVNGPSISGAQSFDNLFTVNGVVVQENLRGQPHNLFIEDAIQETTVQQAGISAEYGNFTGGVVNTITKSGGNEFSGSLRDSITNPTWTKKSPDAFSTGAVTLPGGVPNPNCLHNVPGSTTTCVQRVPAAEPLDVNNNVYEGTLGGRIIRDRLWFFLSGRQSERSQDLTFSNAGPAYQRISLDERREGKLTGAITSSHNLVVSYLEAPASFQNGCQIGCYDMSSIDPSGSNPNDFITGFYNGIITSNFLVEARYAKKTFGFVGYGGEDRDRVTGTVIRLVAPGFGTTVNEPYFCGNCNPEARDNDTLGLKTTMFVGSRSLGNHSITAGAERWHETRLSDNYQSTTDYVFISQTAAPTRDANGNTLVSFYGPATGRAGDYFQYWPILSSSLGSDLNTDSLYVNDKWDLNNRWQFNLGLRYDANDSIDSAGNAVASDSKLSPRLGVMYDVFANGRVRVNATYGTYVGRLAETISGAGSAAGNPAVFQYRYGGPDIVAVSPEEGLRQVWAWFDAQGGIQSMTPFAQNIPGASSKILGSLTSPSVNEWSIGGSTAIGRGFIRADYIRRDWQDFYGSRTTLETGTVTLPSGARANQTFIINTDEFVREYEGIQLQGQYRLFNHLNLGANYTWSQLTGNYTGETSGSGPVTEGSDRESFPEYSFARNTPVGFLSSDRTHKARAWASFDFATPFGNLNTSVLQNFDSGAPYSLTGTVGYAGYVTNPGYVTVPTTATYYISDRGEFRFENMTSTDLALNYSTPPGWLAGVSLFIQGELLNAFNETAHTFNTSVLTSQNNTAFTPFNPLTTDPSTLIECPQSNTPAQCREMGAHFQRGPLFGLPSNTTNLDNAGGTGSYQLPRTYRFSVGLRF